MRKKPILYGLAALVLLGVLFYLYQGGFLRGGKSGDHRSANAPQGGQSAVGAAAKDGQAGTAQQPPQDETPAVEIPADKQQLIGLKTVAVSVKSLDKTIRTVGRVETDERKIAAVNTKYEGYVERLYVDYTGRHVKRGEPVAEIYSPELYATQQEFLNLLKWSRDRKNGTFGEMLAKDGERILDAARERLKLWDITDEQILAIEKNGKPMRTLTIFSPVGGTVTQKMVVQGMRVMAGEKLFELTDLSMVWVVADIYESELNLVKVGDKASIGLSYFPGKVFISTVDYIYPAISGDTRTAKVRFSLSNTGGLLKPQMFTDVELTVPLGKRLSVLEDAVIDTGIRKVVYVDKGEGNFEPREIATGIRAGGLVEVTKGLTAGEKIVSSANFLIDSEAKLRGVEPLRKDGSKKAPAGGPPAGGHSKH